LTDGSKRPVVQDQRVRFMKNHAETSG
jgi:hypothetical protein